MKKITIAIAGCGSRGFHAYGAEFLNMKDKVEITAVADIDPVKLDIAMKTFGLTTDKCFSSAEKMLEQEQLADAMVIATPDRLHVNQAIPALKKGYHLLLEKPISPELSQCRELVDVVNETGKHVVVCHVLRYTPFYNKLKEVLDSGVIGGIGNLHAYEDVGYAHQCHSFVRGNWRNSAESSPMILQKCCHDMDIYMWLLNKTCTRVSSFGNTFLFNSSHAPKGATARCMDGCAAKESCPFDAEKIYITNPKSGISTGHTGWPLNILDPNPTMASITKAVKEGPYGRCVFNCDNDVVDHQIVNLELNDSSTFSFTMSGMTAYGGRWAKFLGTEGQIIADMDLNTLTITRFGEDDIVIKTDELEADIQGHGGGDQGIAVDFINLLSGGETNSTRLSTVNASTESHYMAFAAEESRLNNGAIVELDTFRK